VKLQDYSDGIRLRVCQTSNLALQVQRLTVGWNR